MKEIIKKCIQCKKEFKPFKSTQKVCSLDCALKESKAKEQAKNNKEWQKEKRIRKEKLLTQSDWLQILQKLFNTYIRLRDKNESCISCGTNKNVKYDAGHFFSVGAFPSVRFDEDNVHKQCSNNCNVHLSGNIHNYRPKLIEKIGLERFEKLEFKARNSIQPIPRS